MDPSADVRRLHSALARLGYTLADEEWAAPTAGPTTRLAVLDVQRAQGLTPTGAADAATLAALARQLEGRAPEYRVMGVVRHPNGRPAVGVRVHAFDRDLRREEFLGEARTNARGGFEIPYTADRFARAGKGTADLLLRVYRERAPEGMRERLMNLAGGEPLQELNDPGPEDVLFNAPHVCWVEVRLARGDTRAESEWERLSRELPPLLDGVHPRDLRQDAETRDLTFLHRETGWPAQTLAHFALAHRLAERAGEAPAEYFFALLRENALLGAGSGGVRLAVGLDDETEPLFHDVVLLEPDAARAAVARAVEHGVVPAALAERVDAILEHLAKHRDAAREHVRDERPRQLLRQAERLLQGGAAERVLEVLGRDARGDLPGLLARLQEALRTDGTGDGQNGGADGSALAALLGPDAGVMDQVREQNGLAAGDGARPLARLNRAEWTDALERAAPAAHGEQASGNARLHASALARGLERRFPTPAFAAQLEREGGTASHHEGMLRLFSEHPDFDLATTNIEAFFQDHPGLEAGARHTGRTAALRAGDGAEAGARPEPDAAGARSLKESLKATQRVFRLAPTFRQTTALLDAGVDSAAAIQSMGETSFVQRFGGGRVFADGEAREVFHRAANVSTAASLLAGELQSASAALQVGALSSAGAAPQIQKVTTTFPSLKSLFQTGDACECTHCRSVHSPAAYLVDVLLFLRNRRVVDASAPAVEVKAALSVLLGRRPDLGDLQLDCANTETEVPYIDLVCELLEEATAPDPGFSFTGAAPAGPVPAALLAALQAEGLPFTARAVVSEPDLSGAVVVHDDLAVCKLTPAGAGTWTVHRLRQTHGTSAERGALPEYVNAAAYAALAASRVAFALPFDLHAEETRAYLRQFEVRRDELMRALRNGGPAAAGIAAEAWEIGPVERGLITTPDAAGQDSYWNTGGTPAADALRNVDAFLTRTGMQYAELEALLRMPWIDPDGDLLIRHLDSSCDTAKKEILNLDAAALDRIHRFLRLARKTGWPVAVLEQAVRAARLGGGSMADPFLERLEGAERVSTRLALPREEVCAFYGELPAAGERSLHARVFLDPVRAGTVEPDFRPDALRANEDAEAAAAGSGQPLSAYADALATALGLPRPDLDALAGVAGVGTLLSAGNLARLFALSRLARALRMGGEELAVLAGLTGGDPLATPADTLAFLDRAQRLRDAGATPSDLRYLLRHEAPDLGARALADADATRILQALQQGYRAAESENRSPFAAAAAAAENQAAVKPLLSRLPGFTEAELSAFEAVLEGTSPLTVPAAAALIDQKLGGVTDTTPVKAAQAALATLGAGATEAQREAARNALLQTVLDGVAAHLYAAARDALLPPTVAAAFRLPEDAAGVLLRAGRLRHPAALGAPTLRAVLASTDLAAAANTVADPPAAPPAALDTQLRALRLLHKTAQLAGTLGAGPAELEWLLANAGNLGWLRPDELRYQADPAVPAASLAAWEALRDGLALRRAWPPVPDPADARAPLTFFTLLDRVLAGEPAAAVTGHLARLAGWDPAVVTDLHTRFGLGASALAAYRDPATYRRLEAAVSLLRRLGLSVAEGVGVSAPSPGAGDAARMRAALRARHAESEWLGVLRGVQDRLRTRKRDALVAHLLAANPALSSTTDLFDHFLLDVEMGACRTTSRIVQAHGTVQLFVQRCLMGLEPRSIASVARDDGWAQWPWMREYRAWEANRKVFLWPENWIEPDLRDDQSELFAELLNELQQNELTDRAVEDAAAAYLRRLDAIALLEPMAALYEPERAWMHVFARTKGGDPAVCYYRRFEKERYWTPWEKVDADIKGDHLMAFIRNGRLFLAWPEFSEEPREEQTATVPSSGGGTQTLDAPEKRWKIRFAIAERSGGRWLPKKVSQGALYSPPPPDYTTQLLPAERYRFAVADMGAAGHVVTCTLDHGGESSYQGAFALFGCKGYPEPVQGGGSGFSSSLVFLPHFADTAVRSMRYRELPPGTAHTPVADDLAIRTILDVGAFHPLFNATPGVFKVTYPHQLSLVDMLFILAQLLGGGTGGENLTRAGRGRFVIPLGTFMPFFYEDALRAFTLVPGFYQAQADEPATRIERTFSDIHQLLVDILALAALYYQKLADDPDRDLQKLVDALVKDPEYIRILEEVKVYLKLKYGYEVHALYHPLMCFLRGELDRGGIPALMRRETQLFNTGFDFSRPDQYAPRPQVVPPYPVETLDFAREGAYSAYNWELFFHLPFTIATRLSADQRFAAAQAWFHYIFNPVGAGDAPAPRRYWVTKPFFLKQPAEYQAERIDAIFNTLAADPTGATVGDLRFAVSEWRSKPFKPHVIARSRPVAYQQAVVMRYIQNLIEWGDHEFRRYTQESVNQATQLYLMADQLLGPRPRTVPPLARPRPETYRQLEARADLFGNALVELENLIPDLGLLPEGGAELPPQQPLTLSSLYFCIPQNERMLEYWDRVAERLDNLRHCRNIEGVEAPMSLFAPPIDPGALVRAAAAGLDVSAVLAGLGAPLPFYRFQVMAQKATELAQQVAGLGGALLAALEKRDAEALARLRSGQELLVLAAAREVKLRQIDEAGQAIVALEASRAVIEERKAYYAAQVYMNPWEITSVALAGTALVIETAMAVGYILSGGLKLVPQFMIGAAGFGGSPTANASTGGDSFGNSAEDAVKTMSAIAQALDKAASMAATQGGYQRRQEEWDYQVSLADAELRQMEQQLESARIRVDILNRELAAHDRQVKAAQASDDFMRAKFTGQELYEWTAGQVSSVYFQAYQLAFGAARAAERCFRHELGSDASFLRYGYWDSRRKGLMAAELLLHDVKRMEVAYLEQNRREYELTKHVSLAQLDPAALIQLRNTGACTLRIPEAAFDLDHPGHYMRRLKSVAVSIPAVAGPYSAVGCKLSLVSHRYRKSTALLSGSPAQQYAEDPGNDGRFVYNAGSLQSIATSTGQSDTGMFELNFRDERYLPFEGAGAVGTWRIELPTAFRNFDYATITDVVLQLRYTARDGGGAFRTKVEAALRELLNAVATTAGTGLFQAFSFRHHFPDEWSRLRSGQEAEVTLRATHLPFFAHGHTPQVQSLGWVARLRTDAGASYTITVDGTDTALAKQPSPPNPAFLYRGDTATVALGTAFTLGADNPAELEELTFLVGYSLTT
jgi:hypothetical protein